MHSTLLYGLVAIEVLATIQDISQHCNLAFRPLPSPANPCTKYNSSYDYILRNLRDSQSASIQRMDFSISWNCFGRHSLLLLILCFSENHKEQAIAIKYDGVKVFLLARN
jgi:hypothetical protein